MRYTLKLQVPVVLLLLIAQFLDFALATPTPASPWSPPSRPGFSLDELLAAAVGQHVIFSYPGTTPPPALSSLITAGKVGGVILFGENISPDTPAQMASLQALYTKSRFYTGTPLLLMTDQEGGKVRRLPGGPVQSEKQIGLSADPASAATQAGLDAASALKQYNLNTNLAPVADVFATPGNFDDQFGRSYSNDSHIAAACVAAFVTSQQGAGILATVKHFPGLGTASADQNTDLTAVTLPEPLERIRAVDEEPFRSAIHAHVDMVMPSWAIYPTLDATYPSGLSRKWLQDELRGRLGFRGVIISDALEAGSLAAFAADPGQRAVLAMQAGQDIVLASARNVSQGQSCVDALVQAVKSGKLDAKTFGVSALRVAQLRAKFGLK